MQLRLGTAVPSQVQIGNKLTGVDNLNIPRNEKKKLFVTNDNKLLDQIMAIEYKRKPT